MTYEGQLDGQSENGICRLYLYQNAAEKNQRIQSLLHNFKAARKFLHRKKKIVNESHISAFIYNSRKQCSSGMEKASFPKGKEAGASRPSPRLRIGRTGIAQSV
jgi:hypothetical protein